jgi:type IV secretory pathway VirB2 component (pilin)
MRVVRAVVGVVAVRCAWRVGRNEFGWVAYVLGGL